MLTEGVDVFANYSMTDFTWLLSNSNTLLFHPLGR